jgi:hypothetical protein
MNFDLFSLGGLMDSREIKKRCPVLEEANEVAQERWHFDKTVNLPFAIGIIGLVAAGSMWVASIDQRMARVEAVMVEIAEQTRAIDRLSVKVESMEEQFKESKNRER